MPNMFQRGWLITCLEGVCRINLGKTMSKFHSYLNILVVDHILKWQPYHQFWHIFTSTGFYNSYTLLVCMVEFLKFNLKLFSSSLSSLRSSSSFHIFISPQKRRSRRCVRQHCNNNKMVHDKSFFTSFSRLVLSCCGKWNNFSKNKHI